MYYIIQAEATYAHDALKELANKVDEYVKEGDKPQGGVSIIKCNLSYVACQAMIDNSKL